MKLFNLLIALGFIGCLSLIQSCKDDCSDPTNPDCENYDPCYGKESADAAFHFYKDLTTDYGEYHFQTDTIEVYNDGSYIDVYFKVDDKDVDSCWWTVGADSRVFTQKEFMLTFQKDDAPLLTRLIVDKSSAKSCHPDKPVRDTFYRTLKFMPLGSSNIYGKYHGYFDGNTSDTGTITVLIKRFWNTSYIPILRNSQEPPGIDSGNFAIINTGWNNAFGMRSIGGKGTIPYMSGLAIIEFEKIEINYKYNNENDPFDTYRNRTFKGKKR